MGTIQTVEIPASDGTVSFASNGNTASDYIYNVTDSAAIEKIYLATGGADLKSVTVRIADGKALIASECLQMNNKGKTNMIRE